MTAQIADSVVYQNRWYDLAGFNGLGLFDPVEEGLRVHAMSTGCWRGYICEFTVEDAGLFLTGLELGLTEPPGELFGARLRRGNWGAEYSPIRVRQPYDGGLLLAAGFVESLYVHMGHHPAWKYANVLELIFDDGSLTAVHDRSELMAQRRAAQGTLSPKDLRDLDVWIDTTFDRTYPPML
jgi:hypothetical protein